MTLPLHTRHTFIGDLVKKFLFFLGSPEIEESVRDRGICHIGSATELWYDPSCGVACGKEVYSL